jgi:hypothetical protein
MNCLCIYILDLPASSFFGGGSNKRMETNRVNHRNKYYGGIANDIERQRSEMLSCNQQGTQ